MNKFQIPAGIYSGMLKSWPGTVILVLLFSLSACASAGYDAQQGPPAGLSPGAKFSFEGNTARYADKDITAEASYLSPSQTGLYFSLYKGGRYHNPFPPSYFVFQMTLENRGRRNVSFNPGMVYLLPEKGRPATPEDYTGFYSDLQLAGAEDSDERLDAFKVSVLDTAKTIRPGEKAQGLIVFSPQKDVRQNAVLILNDIYVGSASRTIPLQFRGAITGR